HELAAVQAALGLGKPAPAASALVFTQQHGPRAGPAADARVALVVQRIVGNVVLADEAPDLLLRPVGQRADLHQAEFLVPGDDRGLGPVGALVPADCAGPGVHADHRLLQHLHLAIEAALIGIGAIEWPAVLLFILLDRRVGLLHFHRDAVA